jgi:hypothetical protein
MSAMKMFDFGSGGGLPGLTVNHELTQAAKIFLDIIFSLTNASETL